MRCLLLLLFASTAAAESRVALHAGAGAEAGLIQGKPVPGSVAEVGVGFDYLPGTWGVGVMVERVARGSAELPIASEHKLDVLARFTDRTRRLRGAIGAGIRRVHVDGNLDRPPSLLYGVDVFRVMLDGEIARSGDIAVHLYCSWSFGVYHGEVYNRRAGDVPHTTRDATTLSNTYVAGVRTSIDL